MPTFAKERLARGSRCFRDCCLNHIAGVASFCPGSQRKTRSKGLERCRCRDAVSDRIRIRTSLRTPPIEDGGLYGHSRRCDGRDHHFTRRVTATRYLASIAAAVFLECASWAQGPGSKPAESNATSPALWSFSFNLSGYIVPHDQSYASTTFSADKQHFHLGARYNDEDIQTGSLWAGYNFEIGDKVVLQATPMIGGVFGHTTGIAPGYIAFINWKKLELSTEGEFVFDTTDRTGSFFYSWMEVSYSPLKWCRTGLVAQRTKAYHTSLDIQRGILVGFSHKRLDFTVYVFNAGWTTPTVVQSLTYSF